MGAIGNTLDPSNHDSPIGAIMKPIQKATDPLSWVTGGKWADWTSTDIPRATNQILAPITQGLGKVDKAINPLRRIGIIDQIGDVAEAKPADTIGLVLGTIFSGGALAGAGAGAGGGAGAGAGLAAGEGAAAAGTTGLAGGAAGGVGSGLGGGMAAGQLGTTVGAADSMGALAGGTGFLPSYGAAATSAGLGSGSTAGATGMFGTGAMTFAQKMALAQRGLSAVSNAQKLANSGQPTTTSVPSAPRARRGSVNEMPIPAPLPMIATPSQGMQAMPGATALPTTTGTYQNLLTNMLNNSMQPPTQGLVGVGTTPSVLPLTPSSLIPGRY